MINSKQLLKHTETFLVIILWALLISMPLVFSKTNSSFSWAELATPIQTIAPLFLIFIVNRFLLVPKILLKKKSVMYAALVVVLIGIFSLGIFIFQKNMHEENITRTNIHFQRITPPGSPPIGGPLQAPHPPKDGPRELPPYANFIILAFLLVGFDTGLHAFFKLSQTEKDKSRLEKENVINQLDMLRHQISPHFLMNTLNNIHTLIDISNEKSKEAVIGLSKLMRYLLYETSDNTTTLKNECDFIQSYVDLMKLRVSKKVDIRLNIPNDLPPKNIPPLLFTSFIENAFKHGVSYNKPSFIIIDILVKDNTLSLNIENSNHKKKDQQSSGIGIENSKRRLHLLYGQNYKLNISENEDIFAVHLSIPLKNNDV